MGDIKPIQNEFAGIEGNYGIINQGTGYAVVDILTNEMKAHNISSYLDALKTAEHLAKRDKVEEVINLEFTTVSSPSSDVYDPKIREKINNIKKHSNSHSKFYGKLVNWYSDGFWHYGIGLSDEYIFDLGANLDVFHKKHRKIKFVEKIRQFSPDKTIQRLIYAVCCFKDWHYGFLGWNCEHYSRLVATNVAISYQVKKSPLAFLNHGGYHPTAVQKFTDYLNHLGLSELTVFDN
jgi:hypothetical protein